MLTIKKSHQSMQDLLGTGTVLSYLFLIPSPPIWPFDVQEPEGSGWAIPITFRLLVWHYYYYLFFFCSFPFAPSTKGISMAILWKFSSTRLILGFTFVIIQIKIIKVRILENSYMLTWPFRFLAVFMITYILCLFVLSLNNKTQKVKIINMTKINKI